MGFFAQEKESCKLMPADLHCHTKISDGSTTLDDLILIAKRRRMQTISVTDHDTVAGVTRAKILGDRHGIEIIPGVEFSCYDYKRRRKVHLLAYMFSEPDRLAGICKRISDARKAASAKMISKVMRFYPITTEMVVRTASGSTNIFKQHIMQTLMNAGYANTVFCDLYEHLFGAEKGTCLVEMEYPDVFEVLKLLQSASAITVLAHPSVYSSMELLPELIEAGLDGVEVWHPRNSEADIEKLLEIARQHNLLTTGGSDFHGMYTKKPVPLGTCTTPDECLAAMRARQAQKLKQRRNATANS